MINKLLPFAITTCLYIILRLTIIKSSDLSASYIFNIFPRIPGLFVAVTEYIKLLFLPLNLYFDHGEKLFPWTTPKAIIGMFLSIVLIFYAFEKRATNQLISFSIFFFFVTLLPVSNLYPVAFYMAEHYLYIPSLGFFLIIAQLLSSLYETKKLKIVTTTCVILLISFYSYLTIKQNTYWQTPITFYKRIIKFNPQSAKAHNNLGFEYESRGNRKEAFALYKKAINIDPLYTKAHNNIGVLYLYSGNINEAVLSFKKAIKIEPEYDSAYTNLANVYSSTGNTIEAMKLYKKAIELNSYNAEAYYNLAVLSFMRKRLTLAIEYCDKALKLGFEKAHPDFLKALKKYR
ncbi:MAG: tetratricopeptide repeat protein [Candidatus Saelkia tenebricola]|nr:tetratricopeptide repeat protein [Candidatus Saelkia tenebricola]